MNYTLNAQKKLEALLEAVGYVIRYEKGNFNSGYCLVQNKKIAVINKFFTTEAKINSLIEIINAIIGEADVTALDDKQTKFLAQIIVKNDD